MLVTVKCPQCESALPFAAEETPQAIKCGRCGRGIGLVVSEAVRCDTAVDRCPVCEGTDFYVRKDFNPKAGVAFVATWALISAVFYFFNYDLVAYSILAAAVFIDLLIFRRLKNVTICYRCHAEFRGAYPRTAGAFDLHVADELEPEWQRKIGKR